MITARLVVVRKKLQMIAEANNKALYDEKQAARTASAQQQGPRRRSGDTTPRSVPSNDVSWRWGHGMRQKKPCVRFDEIFTTWHMRSLTAVFFFNSFLCSLLSVSAGALWRWGNTGLWVIWSPSRPRWWWSVMSIWPSCWVLKYNLGIGFLSFSFQQNREEGIRS